MKKAEKAPGLRTVKIPPVFYFDHLARECGKSGVIVKSMKSYLIVDLDEVAFEDLRSDASYYYECADQFDPPMRGLAASAKATLRALEAVI